MVKPEWGIKRICQECGTRYYDLRKNSPICPKCRTPFDPEQVLRLRRKSSIPEESLKSMEEAETGVLNNIVDLENEDNKFDDELIDHDNIDEEDLSIDREDMQDDPSIDNIFNLGDDDD